MGKNKQICKQLYLYLHIHVQIFLRIYVYVFRCLYIQVYIYIWMNKYDMCSPVLDKFANIKGHKYGHNHKQEPIYKQTPVFIYNTQTCETVKIHQKYGYTSGHGFKYMHIYIYKVAKLTHKQKYKHDFFA